MTIVTLLVVALFVCLIVWVIQRGMLPAPFSWIIAEIVVVVLLLMLLQVSGVGGGFLNRPV